MVLGVRIVASDGPIMPVTERVMATGDWSLTLSRDTPESVLRSVEVEEVSGFGTLYVLPTRLQASALTDAALKPLAVYNGIYVSQPSRLKMSGYGAAGWLGFPDGPGPFPKGPYTTPDLFYGTGSYYEDAIAGGDLATGGGLEAAAFTGVPGSYWYAGVSDRDAIPGSTTNRYSEDRTFHIRKMLDALCKFATTVTGTAVEWRVDTQRRLWIGRVAWLYTTTNRGFITETGRGVVRGDNMRPTISGKIARSKSYRRWLNVGLAIRGAPPFGTTASASAARTTSMRRWDGSDLRQTETVDCYNQKYTDRANYSSWASQILDEDSVFESTVEVSTDRQVIPWEIPVGSYVGVHAPEAGVVNSTGGVVAAGEFQMPIQMRVLGATWPISAGCGVYLVRHSTVAGYPTVVDLSDWVVPETGQTRLDVGPTGASPVTLDALNRKVS